MSEYPVEVEVRLNRSSKMDYDFLCDEFGEEFVEDNIIAPSIEGILRNSVNNFEDIKNHPEFEEE